MAADIVIRDTSDDVLSSIDFGFLSPGETSAEVTIRLYNAGDAASAELLVSAATSALGLTGDRNIQGQEAVTEKWLQAKEGAGAWTPVGGTVVTAGNVLSVTPPAASAYTDVVLRLVVPVGASSGGNIVLVPFCSWDVEA